MSNFRTKLLGLAAVATAFAGMSYGQVIAGCTPATGGPLPPNPTLRAESQTELVADEVVTGCTNTIATTGTVFATLTAPVTSKAITPPAGSPGGGNSEAILTVTSTATPVAPAVCPAGCPTTTTIYYGTVSGSTVSFSNVAFPATGGAAPAPATFSYTISNVRVNASGGGAPQITETNVINYSTGATTSSNLPLAAQNVGFILTTLSSTTFPALTTTNFTACGGNVVSGIAAAVPAGNINMLVQFKELVGGAFKGAGPAPTGEGGSLVSPTNGAVAGVGTATTATQIAVTYANIPASSTVWVPSSETITTGGTSTTLTTTGTPPTSGPFSAPYVGAAGTTYGAWVAFTPVSGTVVVTYTVSLVGAGAAGAQTWLIPTVVATPANSAAPQSFMTANASYAPTGTVSGPATAIPTFLASSLTPANGAIITVCQTSMLFPFVTNQLGFDTGIVIANTTTDNLTTTGKSLATPASGTCTLSFYGNTAPTPAVAVPDPLGVTTTGTTHAFTLSSVAPGFQGYMIVTCPFLDAHGFGFLAYNLTQNNGAVEGYLAPILNTRAAAAAETTTF